MGNTCLKQTRIITCLQQRTVQAKGNLQLLQRAATNQQKEEVEAKISKKTTLSAVYALKLLDPDNLPKSFHSFLSPLTGLQRLKLIEKPTNQPTWPVPCAVNTDANSSFRGLLGSQLRI